MPENFRFNNTVYKMASIVDSSIIISNSLLEIDWNSPEVLKTICKFSKISILHYFIFSTISVFYRREFRKNADYYAEDGFADIEATFQEYEIKLNPFNVKMEDKLDDYDRHFYKWFCDQEYKFVELWDVITEEVFQLLFANRRFLLNFNQSIANYLQKGEIIIPQKYQGKRNCIRRDRYIPSWLKKAVYLRDHGRCVLCQKDLTGLISIDISLHYDHIVPLSQWGINDPCNIQLLCDKCNLRKSDKEIVTGIRYPTWW